MGLRATLETDTAERLRLWLPDGSLGGKALLAFITALHTWCDNETDTQLQEWFATLEQSGTASLCPLMHSLLTAWYTGFWDFQPDDYPIYQLRYPDDPLTEAEFKQNLASITQRWVRVDALTSTTRYLIQHLSHVSLPETWWYHPVWTLWDLLALADTLHVVQSRHATLARIQFA